MKKQKKESLLDASISLGGVNISQKIIFTKHLAVMLKSGLTITEALDIIYDQSEGKLKKIIATVKESVSSGNSLSGSLGKFPKVFSSVFINSIYVGESSGTLDENLESVAASLTKDRELINKIKNAMFYPMIILFLAFGLGIVMSFLVLPRIMPLFEGLGIELPATTRMLIWFSKIIEEHGREIFIGIVIFLISFSWLLRQKFSHPATHYLILKVPIVGDISRNKNLALFCNTLGTLLKSGLSIDRALDITQSAASNYYYKKSLAVISSKTGKGMKLSENLEKFKTLFPSLATNMVKIGERSGRLEETLFYLGGHYEDEVDTAVKRFSTAIEPMLLIFIGLFVGGLAMSIITPIYQLTGNVQK